MNESSKAEANDGEGDLSSVPDAVACLPAGWLDGSMASPSPLAIDNLLRFLAERPAISRGCVIAHGEGVIRMSLPGRWWRLDVGLRDDGGANLSGSAWLDARPYTPEDFPSVDDDFLAKFDAYWSGDRRVTDEGCPVGRDLRRHIAGLAEEFFRTGRFAAAPRVDAPGFDLALVATLSEVESMSDPFSFLVALREAATSRILEGPRGACVIRLFAIPLSGPSGEDILGDDALFDGFVDSLKEHGVAADRSVLIVARRMVSADRFAAATPGLVAALMDAFGDAYRGSEGNGDVLGDLDDRLGDLFAGELPTSHRRIGGPLQSFLVGVRFLERNASTRGSHDYLESFSPPRKGTDHAAEWARSASAYLPERVTVGPPMGWNDAVVRSACELVHGEVDFERRAFGRKGTRARRVHVAVTGGCPVYVAVEEDDLLLGPFAVPESMALCDLDRFEGFLTDTFDGEVLRHRTYADMPNHAKRS